MSTKVRPFQNKIKKQVYAIVSDSDKTLSEVYAEIKKKMKVSQKQLTYWLENKGEQPTISQASLLADILNCTIDDLVQDEKSTKQKRHFKQA